MLKPKFHNHNEILRVLKIYTKENFRYHLLYAPKVF